MATFRDQLDALIKIQKIDSRARELRGSLAGVPDRCAQLTQRLETFAADVAARTAERDALKQSYRGREHQVKDLSVLVGRSNARLQEVKTNKEYESVLKEIDDVKRHISEIEDIMITDLDAMDLAETVVAAAASTREAAEADIEAEIETLSRRAERDKQELSVLAREASALSADVDQALLTRYRYIQQRKPDAVAVCEVIDAVCQGCKLSIPQQLYNNLQRQEALTQCPKCDRIVYWLKRIQ